MKHNLYPIFIDKLKEIYGFPKENTSYLYKYLYIRTAIFHNKRKVKNSELFDFILDELNLTVFNKDKIGSSHIIYDEQKYLLFELSSEIMDNMVFRAEIEGDIDYKEQLETIFTKGYRKAYKYRKLPVYKKHLMLQRLNALNDEFGASPTYCSGIENFTNDENHNPFKRTLEERLEIELKSSQHGESNTTTYISEETLEDYLVENLELIEPGLQFMKRQVSVTGGIIDVIAKDGQGNLCIIELKVKEDKKIIWQTLYYPTTIKSNYNVDKVRMITVVPTYSQHIYQALKANKNVECFDYKLKVKDGKITDLKINKYNECKKDSWD